MNQCMTGLAEKIFRFFVFVLFFIIIILFNLKFRFKNSSFFKVFFFFSGGV